MPSGGQFSGNAIVYPLLSNVNYYVRTDGSDNNDGSADTSSRAFLTIQKAIDVASSLYNIYGFKIYIYVGNGIYVENLTLKPFIGSQKITITNSALFPTVYSTVGGFGSVIVQINNVTGPGYELSGLNFASDGISTQDAIRVVNSSLQISQCGIVSVRFRPIYVSGGEVGISGLSVTASGTDSYLLSGIRSYVNVNGHIDHVNPITYAFGVLLAGDYTEFDFTSAVWDHPGNVTGQKFALNTLSLLKGSAGVPGTVAGTTATGSIAV
jgi:hypothetical protein